MMNARTNINYGVIVVVFLTSAASDFFTLGENFNSSTNRVANGQTRHIMILEKAFL